jgi:hypothetical protein
MFVNTYLIYRENDVKVILLISNKIIDCYLYNVEGVKFINYSQEFEFEAINELYANRIMDRYVELVYASAKSP